MKTIIKRALRTMGLDVVKYPPTSPIDLHLKDFISAKQVDLVLDVGAFGGQFCKVLRERVGYLGAISSFEPCADSFEKLSSAMASDNRWTGHQYGLSSSRGEAILNTFEKGDFNSVNRMKSDGAAAFGVGGATSETIQLHRLDEVWPSVVGDHKRVFLKIDTQGHDTEVLLGAKGILKNVVGILSEIPVVEIYQNMPSMPETLKCFRDAGYAPIGFYPVNYGYHGRPAEFDVIFSNDYRENI